MLEVVILGSGSGGNACVIRDQETMILVDAGFSCGQISKRMALSGLDIQQLSGCIVTHEHRDHIHGLRVLFKRYRIPLFMHPATHRAAAKVLAGDEVVHHFELGERFNIGDLEITSVPTLHDAAAPTGFRITGDGVAIGYLTDLGAVTEDNFLAMRQVDYLVMEANHDRDTLWRGPYPDHLKARVDGRLGHLSNEDSAEFTRLLAELGQLRGVTLAHLSEQNNTPEMALEAYRMQLDDTFTVRVASQHQPLEPIRVERT